MSLEDRAVEAYNDWQHEKEEKLRDNAVSAFTLAIGVTHLKSEAKVDHWGEHVIIRASGLTFRCNEDHYKWQIRLGRRSWRGWRWSFPISSLEDLGEKVVHFRVGL